MRYEPRLAAETRFGHLLATRPAAVVFSLALLHFLGLAFVILLTQPTLGLDVFEQVAWARDPQWAYAKHPPLPAWIMAAAIWAAGNKPWIAAILGAATSAAALPIVWVLARRVVGTSQALIAVFLLEGVIYFNFASVDFNHNVILLPLWAFIAYAAHRAFVEGKLIDWALLGIAAALGMLGKYATALLLIAVLAAFLADRAGTGQALGQGASDRNPLRGRPSCPSPFGALPDRLRAVHLCWRASQERYVHVRPPVVSGWAGSAPSS